MGTKEADSKKKKGMTSTIGSKKSKVKQGKTSTKGKKGTEKQQNI